MVKLKKYKKFGEIVNFIYLNKYEVGKYVFVGGYLEIFGKNMKENIDKNDKIFFVYCLCIFCLGDLNY